MLLRSTLARAWVCKITDSSFQLNSVDAELRKLLSGARVRNFRKLSVLIKSLCLNNLQDLLYDLVRAGLGEYFNGRAGLLDLETSAADCLAALRAMFQVADAVALLFAFLDRNYLYGSRSKATITELSCCLIYAQCYGTLQATAEEALAQARGAVPALVPELTVQLVRIMRYLDRVHLDFHGSKPQFGSWYIGCLGLVGCGLEAAQHELAVLKALSTSDQFKQYYIYTAHAGAVKDDFEVVATHKIIEKAVVAHLRAIVSQHFESLQGLCGYLQLYNQPQAILEFKLHYAEELRLRLVALIVARKRAKDKYIVQVVYEFYQRCMLQAVELSVEETIHLVFTKVFALNNNELILELVRYCDVLVARDLHSADIVRWALRHVYPDKISVFLGYYKMFLAKRLLSCSDDRQQLLAQTHIELRCFFMFVGDYIEFNTATIRQYDLQHCVFANSILDLDTEFTEKMLSIPAMIHDIKKTSQQSTAFESGVEFSGVILSGRHWPSFESKNFDIKFPSVALQDTFDKFNETYITDPQNSHKNLRWNMSLGKITLAFNFAQGTKQIVTDLCIAWVLLLFNQHDSLTYQEILSLLNPTDEIEASGYCNNVVAQDLVKEKKKLKYRDEYYRRMVTPENTETKQGAETADAIVDPNDIIKRSLNSLKKTGILINENISQNFTFNENFSSAKETIRISLSRK